MHNIKVYPKPIAIDFIKECKQNNIPILGIDAFIVKPNFHQPSMNDSIDFTTPSYVKANKKDVSDEAIAFLQERDSIFTLKL